MFHSQTHPGALMNRYGVVIIPGVSIHQVSPAQRDAIHREARDAGWTLTRSDDRDTGLVWQEPDSALP